MPQSTIQINIDLDENKVPQAISWKATDSSADIDNPAKSLMVSFWDGADKSALRASFTKNSENHKLPKTNKSKRMGLEQQVMEQMKEAMKSKNEAMLRGLRAIKAEIIKAKTEPGANGVITEDAELKMLQKMMKSRKDSLEIYQQQSRSDLAQKEMEEIAIIEKFLPAQLSEEALTEALKQIIAQTGATGLPDLGKVMGVASKQFAGQADGKLIAALVKQLLTNG